MEIGGLQKLTLIDYPKKLACTVFTAGCNFRCPFCYSSELVLPEKIKNQPRVSQLEFFKFLEGKKGLIEGVVICGGEPTVHKDLIPFVKKIKKLGFSVKLDTNGSNPAVLKKLIGNGLIDYVAMDIKGPKDHYQKISMSKISVNSVERSVKILKESKIDSEFRTTVVPGLLDKKEITQMARWIGPGGNYYLQNFRPEKTIDPKYEQIKPYSDEKLLEIRNAIAPLFDVCELRGV